MTDLPRCRTTSWSDIERFADGVAERVRAAQASPDAIVALTRGGWVPGRLLCDRLGVKRLFSLGAQHWGVTATPSGKAELTEGLSGPVADLNVLVVDDITDTGESLALAVEHVKTRGPRRIESATFLHIEHSKFVPTYFAEAIPRTEWAWIVFPWNYWEDLATLAARAAALTPGVEAVQRTLRAHTGLEVPRADLERVARFTPLDGAVGSRAPASR